MPEQTIRVFISSPSDVEAERKRAGRVIERLNGEFDGRVHLEAIRWEESFYAANSDFQSQIPSPDQTDIVVCILWKRLGSYLPPGFDREDGSSRTGTEYEFEVALDKALQVGLPDLFMFRKTAPVMFEEGRVAEEQAQKAALDAFWNRWFHDEEGHFTAGFQSFQEPDDFEQQLETLLRGWIESRLTKVTWPIETKGSPFLGLEPFTEKHAPVFFGRRRATKQARAKLLAAAARNPTCGYLLILGMSGSGKSSVARAGLLPAMTKPGGVPGVDAFRRLVIRPHERGSDVVQGLAEGLFSEGALPELVESDFPSPVAMAEALREEGEKPVLRAIIAALKRIGKDIQEKEESKKTPVVRFILVLDQLEELFTAPMPDQEIVARFMDGLARYDEAYVIATMRSDFYGEYQKVETLVGLRDDGATYDLVAPTETELAEMIEGPAAAAGLVFEEDEKTGENLSDVLERESNAPGVLPLMAIMLQSLFQRRDKENGTLLFSVYRDLGGLEGVIGRRADEILNAQPANVQEAFPVVLRSLVKVSQTGEASARTVPLKQFPKGSPERALVDAMAAADARLLVIEGQGDDAHFHVAHEALLRNWRRAADQIEQDKKDLQARSRLEQACELYESASEEKRPGLLISASVLLSEAGDLLDRRREELTPPVIVFIEESLEADLRRREAEAEAERRALKAEAEAARKVAARTRLGAIVATVLILIASVLGGFTLIQQGDLREAELEREQRVALDQDRVAGDAERLLRDGFTQRAAAIALEALPGDLANTEERISPKALNILNLATSADPTVRLLRHQMGTIQDSFFMDSGRVIVLLDANDRLMIYSTLEPLYSQSFDNIDKIRPMQDGRHLVIIDFDGNAELYDVHDQRSVWFLDREQRVLDMTLVGNNPNLAAVIFEGNFIEFWNIEEDEPIEGFSADQFDLEGGMIMFGQKHAADAVTVGFGDGTVVRFHYFERTFDTLYQHPEKPPLYVEFSDDQSLSVTIADRGEGTWEWNVWAAGEDSPAVWGTSDNSLGLSATFSFDGRYVMVGKSVLVDMQTRTEMELPVGDAVLRPDGSMVAVFLTDSIALWRPTGTVLAPVETISTQDLSVDHQVFSEDGRYLLVNVEGGKSFLWDVGDRDRLVWHEEGYSLGSEISLTRDGQYILLPIFEDDVGYLSRINTETGERTRVIEAIVPPGGPMCSDDGAICMAERDDVIGFYNVSVDPPRLVYAVDDEDNTYLLAQDFTGQRIAYLNDGDIAVFDARTGEQLFARDDLEAYVAETMDPVYFMEFANNGRDLIVGSGNVVSRWRLDTNEISYLSFPGDAQTILPHPTMPYALILNTDGYLYAFDTNTARRTLNVGTLEERVESASWSAGSDRFVTIFTNNVARVWSGGEVIFSVPNDRWTDGWLDRTGRYAMTAYVEDIAIWDIETGSARYVLQRELKLSHIPDMLIGEGTDQIYSVFVDHVSEMLVPRDRANDVDFVVEARAKQWYRLSALERQGVNLREQPVGYIPYINERSGDATTCDDLAASPDDRQALSHGVDLILINADTAIDACRQAVEESPEEARFQYQLSRALDAAGQDDEADTWLKSAAEAGWPAAMAEYGEQIRADEPELGRSYLERAVEAGDPVGMSNMASVLFDEVEEDNNLEEILRLSRGAAQSGHYNTMALLAAFSFNSLEDTPEELARGIYFGTIASRLTVPENNPQGFYRLSDFVAVVANHMPVDVVVAARRSAMQWQPGNEFDPAYDMDLESFGKVMEVYQ